MQPWANMGKPPREAFLVLLREAREERLAKLRSKNSDGMSQV